MATKSIQASGGDYADPIAWEAALSATLTEAEIGEMADETFTLSSTLTFAGTTTTSSFDITLTKQTGASPIITTSGATRTIIDVQDQYVTLEHFTLTEGFSSVTGHIYGIYFGSGGDNCTVRYLKIHDLTAASGNTRAWGIYSDEARTGIKIYRNFVWDIQGAGTQSGRGIIASQWTTAGTWEVYNNSVLNCGGGTGSRQGIRCAANITGGTITCKNNIAMDAATADYIYDNADYGNGSGTITTDDNLSSDATADDNADGAHYISETSSSIFISVTGGSEDLHLQSGTNAIDNGTNLGSPYDIDIDGTTVTGSWDIGADEYVAAGSWLNRNYFWDSL